MNAKWMTIVAMVLAAGVWARAEDKVPAAAPAEVKYQTMCPIMEGNKINKSVYLDYEGKRVYFCCKGCPEQFSKDTAKNIEKMEKSGITLYKVQATCPVTGEKLENKDLFVDYEGKRVYLCCAGCVEKLNADAKAIVAKMEAGGIALDKAPEKKEKK